MSTVGALTPQPPARHARRRRNQWRRLADERGSEEALLDARSKDLGDVPPRDDAPLHEIDVVDDDAL